MCMHPQSHSHLFILYTYIHTLMQIQITGTLASSTESKEQRSTPLD